MPYPLTMAQWIKQLARETARMSYPGGMSRGAKPIVKNGTKKTVEEYFATRFPLKEVWSDIYRVAQTYDNWHREQTYSLEGVLRKRGCLASRENEGTAVAAKFINTFMHQLMKYERFRPLWQHLHLPLDARVLASLKRIQGTSARELRRWIGGRRAYSLSYEDYARVQSELWNLVSDLNDRRDAEFKISSRIELNFLWL